MLLAELEGDGLDMVAANDARRCSFTVTAGARLLTVAGDDLSIVHEWTLGAEPRGTHASLPDRRLALVSGADRVTLLEAGGTARWSLPHMPWAGNRESGCTWFDAAGRPFAVIPSPGDGGCLIVHLDAATGRPVAHAAIAASPAGIEPIHQANGWVALSEGEGQDATRAWWVRAVDDAGRFRLEVLDAGWDDAVLMDADRTGDRVLVGPHVAGPLTVRSFPDLRVLREVSPPDPEEAWDFTACFVREHLVARLLDGVARTVAVDRRGRVEELDVGPGWLVPAWDSWLTVERTRLRRWTLV